METSPIFSGKQLAFPGASSKGRSPFRRGLLWGTSITLVAMMSASCATLATVLTPWGAKLASYLPQSEAVRSSMEKEDWKPFLNFGLSRPIHVLVMGIDQVPSAPLKREAMFQGRTDTLLLLRFDPRDHSFSLLSIPRDSRVEIPGYGRGKINQANVFGGATLTARTTSRMLDGLTIDRYVRVTTDAFRVLVDLVGGIKVFVPYPMSYRDQTQQLDINLEAGWQTLNGEEAEQFARFRQDRYGDIGRVQRQQVLLKALRQRLQNPTFLARLPKAIQELQAHVDTNLSWEEILSLSNFGRSLKPETFKMVMLPGRFSQNNEFNSSYWIIDSQGRDRVMASYFGQNADKYQASGEKTAPLSSARLGKIRVAVQNASDSPHLSTQLVSYLTEYQLKHVYVSQDSPELLRRTQIIVQQGDFAAAKQIQSWLGLGQIEASSTGELSSDVTIRIGLDAVGLFPKH